MLNALSTLQLDSPALSRAEAIGQSLKLYVSSQLNNLNSAGQSRPIADLDGDVIDMVGMIFDFILDDNTLPNTVKALIGRLQIPIVKVAILEKGFFANKSHPARGLTYFC